MDKDSPVAGGGDSRAAPLTKRQARAWQEYQRTQDRIKAMVKDQKSRHPPHATVTAPTRRALDLTPQQRGEMCSLYYAGVPAKLIAKRFGCSAVTVRAIVKKSLIALSVVFECVLMGSAWVPIIIA